MLLFVYLRVIPYVLESDSSDPENRAQSMTLNVRMDAFGD